MTAELAKTLAEITKIGETDPKAADAALQRMRLAREAQRIVAPSDTEDFDLGDLEAGRAETEDRELREVLADIAELGADVEDTPKLKHETRAAAALAAYAAAKAPATPTVQAVAVAEKAERTDIEDFDHTPKTESSVAAALAAAGGPNTTTLAEGAVAEEAQRTNIDLNLMLGDLEFGVGETDEVIENLDELDAYAEDAVEAAIAKSEAYEDQPNEPTTRTVAIQEYKARQPTRGAPRPAACKEFGIDPTDPMAVDKVRIAYELKKVGKTLAGLEKYDPGFWTLPFETDDGSPSRKLVLSRFLWRRNDDTKTKEKAVERQKKRAAKGYPADYDTKTPAERKRITNRLAKKWSRERVKSLKAAGPSA